MNRPLHWTHGFSLTEIMVGVFIMAIVLFPTLLGISRESSTVTGTREHSEAAYLGQRIIETARTYNFERLSEFASEYQAKSFKVNGVEYKVDSLLLSDVKAKDPDGKVAAKKLTFSLKYSSQKHDLSLDLVTVIARHE